MDTQHTYQSVPTGSQPPLVVDQPGPFMVYEPQLWSPPKKRGGRFLIGLLAVVAALGLVLGGSWFVFRGKGFLKDSGVAACGQLRDESGQSASAVSADTKPTAAEYHATRRQFSGSRYGDIRDAGTKLTDLAWQMTQLNATGAAATSAVAALAMVGQFAQDYSSLAGACANHGVDLPPLTK